MALIHIRDIPAKNENNDGLNYYFTHEILGLLDLNVQNFNPFKDILIKENVHSDDFIRVYLKHFNPNKSFCSHILLMDNGTNKFLLTDAAMNIEPTLTDLVKIVENATKFWYKLNPDDELYYHTIHVNFVNYSGSFSIKNKDSITANNLKTYFEINEPGKYYFTNWQIDTCLYPESRKAKSAESLLSPNIIVVPNISVGNAIYKCLLHEYNCLGFLVGGTRAAVLNSRSDLDKNQQCIKMINELDL